MNKANFISAVLLLCLAYQLKAQRQPPLVSVTGTGEVRVVPDKAVISIGVETRDPSLEQAAQETDSKAAAIIAYLKDQGIEDKDIQTSYVSIQPYYAYRPDGTTSTTPDYYIASKTMTFVLRDLTRYDSIMLGLYGAGVNMVNSVSFGISNEDQYKEQARVLAVANAVQIATTLTSELNAGLGNIYAISENTSVPPPIFGARFEAAAADVSGPSIAPGEIVITSTVNISFRIDQ